jgi:hypothetical protein
MKLRNLIGFWMMIKEAIRYLCYRDWPEIMYSLHRSSSTIFYMHRKAMEKVEKIIKQKNSLPEFSQ